MPRKLIAIAAAATIAVVGTVAAQAMTAEHSQARGFVPRVSFKQLARVNGTTAQGVAFTRSPDGVLHLVYQTFSGKSLNGLASMSISPPRPQFTRIAPGFTALSSSVPTRWWVESSSGRCRRTS
jgi:hypothetical protein